jgi:hypothetical protein
MALGFFEASLVAARCLPQQRITLDTAANATHNEDSSSYYSLPCIPFIY